VLRTRKRFLGPTCVEHRARPLFDALVERARRCVQADDAMRTLVRARVAPPLLLPIAERPAGLVPHLERPHDALLVVRVDARGGARIGACELGVQLGRAFELEASLELGAQGAIDRRALEQSAQQAPGGRRPCHRRTARAGRGSRSWRERSRPRPGSPAP
jgi:hypothetical protein